MKYQENFYLQRTTLKKVKIAGFIIFVIFVIIQTLKMVYQTPVFTGRIINSVDGKPVKDAVITAVWWKSSIKGLMPCYSVSVITGEKGQYKIPKYTRIHRSRLYLPDPYFHMSFEVSHPLYKSIDIKSNLVWEEKNSRTGKINFNGEKTADGSINYDILLDGLRERFLLRFEAGEINRGEIDRIIKTWNPGGFLTHLENYVNGWYWKVLKEQNISYDISETFNKWEEIAAGIDSMDKTGRGTGETYSEKVYKARVEILTNLGL
ncbi:MAG: hypothetical protein AB1498_00585 [bacterium]